jgi:hypothetical protein
MPLTQWSDDDLGDLIGRKEGQLLEAKGPEIDLSRPEDRRKLARETAGLASTMGGILVIGAAETGGVVTALPGIADAGDAESRLRNALRDLVTPLPHIQTRSFVVTPETSVIVVEVLPDPAGRPVMVSGDGFWMRAEDSTVRMPYSDIELRLQHAADGLARTSERAEELLSSVRPSLIPTDEVPMGVALVPVTASMDLGRTAWTMQETWWEIANSAISTWESIDPVLVRNLTPLPEPIVTGHGLSGENSTVRFDLEFDGGVVGAFPLEDLRGREASPYPDPYKASVPLTHFLGVSIAVQRRLGVAGPVLLRFVSGHSLSADSIASKPDPVTRLLANTQRRSIQFESPLNPWMVTADSAAAALTTFLTRLTDQGSTYPKPPPDLREERRFLAAMLP